LLQSYGTAARQGANRPPPQMHKVSEIPQTRANLTTRVLAPQPLEAPQDTDTSRLAHDPPALLASHTTPSLCTLAPARRMATQSFVAAQASPQHSHQHTAPHGLPTAFSQSFNMPYDGSPHAHPSAHAHPQHTYSQSFPNGPVSNPGYARSFGEGYASGRNHAGKPQIYTVRKMSSPGASDRAY
jgi:hypothetical protein